MEERWGTVGAVGIYNAKTGEEISRHPPGMPVAVWLPDNGRGPFTRMFLTRRDVPEEEIPPSGIIVVDDSAQQEEEGGTVDHES